MSANYMVIQSISAKVPLLAVKNKYSISFGDYKMEMTKVDEAINAFKVYACQSKNYISSQLRSNYRDITPSEIDEFVDKFKKDHPTQPIEWSFESMPLLSSPGHPIIFDVLWFDAPVYITYTQEKELMGILCSGKDNINLKLYKWFRDYCDEYAFVSKRKKDRDYQDEWLSDVFCMAHGIDIDVVDDLNAKAKEPEQEPTTIKEGIISVLMIIIAFFAYIAIASFLITNDDTGMFWVDFLCPTLGFAMLGVPIYLLFRNVK